MNKKFFGALAFGALVAASTGTFVSCTDYDDDIDNLQEQINGLKDLSTRVSSLESSVAAANSAATGAQSAADAAKAAAATAQSTADAAKAAAAAAQTAADELKAKVAAMEAAGSAAEAELAAAKAAAEGAQATADAAKTAAQEAKDAVKAAQDKATEIANELASIKTDLQALKDAINGAGSGSGSGSTPGYDDTSLVNKVSALESRVAALIGNSIVSSIVFDGTLYMDGIESQEYIYFMYQPIIPTTLPTGPFQAYDGNPNDDATIQTFDALENKTAFNGYNADYLWETDANWVGSVIRNEKVVNTVNYLINPASAKVQLKNLAMYGKDVTLVTRASSGVDYSVDVTNSVNLWKEQVVEEKGHQARLVTVPYTAAGAHYAAIEDSEYNGNTYYNELPAALVTTVATPAAAKFMGVDYTGKYYCHDLEENGDANYDNGTNTTDEGNSNVFQLVANFQDGSAPSVESDYAMLYASPITPQAIAYTGAKVDKHQVYGSQAGGATVEGKVVTVGDCPQATKELHLYRTMQEAIENAANFEVAYYKDQVDLKTFLEVHYNRYSKIAAHSKKHASWAYDEIGRYGLNWNFELVDWNHGISGVADTYAHQSQFANPTAAKNGVLIPCKVNADGSTNTAETTKADYAIIGKEPIMKVTVTDSNNSNAVVLIGFVKFKIVERLGVHDMGIIDTYNHVIDCSNFVSHLSIHTTWNEFQYNVLQEAVGLSYVEFCSLYELDVNQNGNAYQYRKTGTLNQDGDPEFELLGTDDVLVKCPRLTNTVGILKEISNVQVVGNNDNGLEWQLNACELRDIYLNRGGEATTYVRYVRKDGSHSSKDPVYVAVQIKVGYKYPTAGSISDKLDEYWFQNEVDGTVLVSKPSNKAGNDESKMDGVRANVWEPTNGTTVTDDLFDYSLTSAWTGNTITFDPNAKTPATTAVPHEYFYFHPATNHVTVGKYTLAVESLAIDVDDDACTTNHANCATGSVAVCPASVSIGANAQEAIQNVYDMAYNYYSKPSAGTLYQNTVVKIYEGGIYVADLCTLNKVTGKIHYNNNAAAKEILNMFSHHAAEAYIYVGVYGLNETCPEYVDPMLGYTYTVHFLRPIECVEGNEKDLIDAHQNGDKFYAYDLFNDFQDWRDVKFVPNNVWYFYYYHVQKIKLDLQNATTTLNGSNWAKLSDITNEVILEHWDEAGTNLYSSLTSGSFYMPITYGETEWAYGSNANQATLESYMKKKFGYLVYHNNMGNVADFKVRIPVSLIYDWGELGAFTVTINISSTIGN